VRRRHHPLAVLCLALCAGCFGRIDDSARAGGGTGGAGTSGGGTGGSGQGGPGPWEVFVSENCTSMTADDSDLYVACFADIERISKRGEGPTPVLTEQNDKGDIAVDGDDLYWTRISDRTTRRSDVLRMPKRGGAVEIVAADQANARGVQIDDRNLYWLVEADSKPTTRVMARSKTGGMPWVVYESRLGWFTIDGDWVYVVDYSTPVTRLLRISKGGGSPVPIASAPDGRSLPDFGVIALAGGFAGYYIPPTELRELDLASGTSRVVTTVDRSSDVSSDGRSFFFAAPGLKGTAIRAWDAGGSQVRTIAETTFIDDTFITIIPTASRVYWLSAWWPHGEPKIRHEVRSVPRP
jgi:hypothetical protein